MEPDLITDYNFFKDVFRRFVNDSLVFKENQMGFLMSAAFLIKTYLNSYQIDRCDTGESRFLMLYSEEMNTGKSSAMRVLAHGQGVRSESNKMILSCGDGRKVGTTTKPLKQIFENTNVFVFLNDYVPNPTIDELLLQAHEGYGQGSGNSEVQKTRASILLTSNKHETKRLLGRVLRVQFQTSDDFNPTDLNKYMKFAKSNSGFLIAWCHHFASVWYEDDVQDFIDLLDQLLKKYSPFTQGRYTRAWGATLTAFILIMFSTRTGFEITSIIQYVLDLIRNDGKIFNQVTCIENLESNVLVKLTENTEKPGIWIKVDASFRDLKGRKIEAVAIRASAMDDFSDIDAEPLGKELKSIYGENSCNKTVYFEGGEKDKKANIGKKAYKIPEVLFSDEGRSKIYEALGKVYNPTDDNNDDDNNDSMIEDNEERDLKLRLVAIKNHIKVIRAEKLGLPHHSKESLFCQNLTPNGKRNYLQSSPKGRLTMVSRK